MSNPKREGALALQMDGERCNNVYCVAPGAFGDGGSGAGSMAVAQPAPPTAPVKYEFPTNDWPQLPGEVTERKHVPGAAQPPMGFVCSAAVDLHFGLDELVRNVASRGEDITYGMATQALTVIRRHEKAAEYIAFVKGERELPNLWEHLENLATTVNLDSPAMRARLAELFQCVPAETFVELAWDKLLKVYSAARMVTSHTPTGTHSYGVATTECARWVMEFLTPPEPVVGGAGVVDEEDDIDALVEVPEDEASLQGVLQAVRRLEAAVLSSRRESGLLHGALDEIFRVVVQMDRMLSQIDTDWLLPRLKLIHTLQGAVSGLQRQVAGFEEKLQALQSAMEANEGPKRKKNKGA